MSEIFSFFRAWNRSTHGFNRRINDDVGWVTYRAARAARASVGVDMRRTFDRAMMLSMAVLAIALILNAWIAGWSVSSVFPALVGLGLIGLCFWHHRATRIARWKAAAAIPEQWERFRAGFADAALGMTLADLQGRFLEVNPAFRELVGYSELELLDMDFLSLTHPDDRERNLELIQRLLAGEIPSFLIEKRFVRKDGGIVWVRNSVSLNRGVTGRSPNIITLCEDITERHKAAEALRLSEELFRTLADSIPQLAWMTRPDGHIFWYNKRWYDYTGTTPEQMEGWGWQSVHDPAELPRVLANWKAALAKAEPWEDTFPLRRHDGQMRWHLSRALPLKDEQGRVVYWFGTNTDISDRLQMEEALRQADRRKDEFLATLAHELRNPLAPISNALQIMQLSGDNSEAVKEARTMMERQLRQLVRLVDDLLDVSRITRDKLTLRPERVELAAVVRDAVETSRPLIEAGRLDLTIALPPEPIVLEADRTRLAQVFANLLNNASKYTAECGRIWLIVERQGSDAVVTVRDTGIGISAEMLPRIFEMFEQGDRTQERAQGGLGIGLTLVRRLVELHGGHIEARSDGPGRGSQFLVRLPILVQAPTAAPGTRTLPRAPAGDERKPSMPSHRVLVVDDNRDAADSLSLMLRMMGSEVQTVYDGPQAVSVAGSFHPDIIFLDIGMPTMNGYEVCRHIRQQPDAADIVIVALTGWGQEEDRRRSREAGFNQHLVKPADPAALQTLLASPALNRSGR